ncbi:hypothetical protein [Paractinoplanes durhamensis]|uniref:hypothetical protein n=1 Tax=Paractinoplanes durhamensis TaxID=113563 RepID=UPI0019454E04|nr:hypothetical protein [Actinoplanes durhamensis]
MQSGGRDAGSAGGAQDGSAIVTNANGGANGSSFSLRIGTTAAFSGGVRQQITVPAGTYQLAVSTKTTGTVSAAQVTVTDAGGAVRTLTVPAGSAWTVRRPAAFTLAAGTATVAVQAAGTDGYLYVDGLSLVRAS